MLWIHCNLRKIYCSERCVRHLEVRKKQKEEPEDTEEHIIFTWCAIIISWLWGSENRRRRAGSWCRRDRWRRALGLWCTCSGRSSWNLDTEHPCRSSSDNPDRLEFLKESGIFRTENILFTFNVFLGHKVFCIVFYALITTLGDGLGTRQGSIEAGHCELMAHGLPVTSHAFTDTFTHGNWNHQMMRCWSISEYLSIWKRRREMQHAKTWITAWEPGSLPASAETEMERSRSNWVGAAYSFSYQTNLCGLGNQQIGSHAIL